jgi:O-antigen/teichoic acid export membrane protein
MIPATVCWWITNASDRYMVTFFRGEAENGLYAAAYKIPNLLVIAAGIFTDAWQFSAVVENRRAEQARTPEEQIARRRSLTSFFSKTIKGYSAFLFLAAAGLLLLCRPIASVLFDPSFDAAWHYIPTLILATVFSSLSAFTASVYMVERRSVAALVTASIGAAVNIVLNLCLIPSFGAMGAAIATALSYLVVLVVRLVSTRRSIPYRYAPVWQLICVSLLTLMAILITNAVFGWVVWSVLLFLATAALSFVHLLPNALSYLKERHKKK